MNQDKYLALFEGCLKENSNSPSSSSSNSSTLSSWSCSLILSCCMGGTVTEVGKMQRSTHRDVHEIRPISLSHANFIIVDFPEQLINVIVPRQPWICMILPTLRSETRKTSWPDQNLFECESYDPQSQWWIDTLAK